MEKSAQSRSIGNIISPLRYIGKKYLSSRSDTFKETLEVTIKADDAFRDVVSKQNNYLKAMDKDRKRLEAVKFAQDTAAFLREQAVLVELVGYMRDKYAEKIGIEPNSLKSIDYYVSSEIGKTPEYNPNQIVEKKVDVEQQWEMERPSSIKRWMEYYTNSNDDWARLETDQDVKTSFDKTPELISEAFLASWFWGKTQSGKELIKAFGVVYSNISNMLKANLSLLKTLDGFRSQGDSQAYWDAVKGKNGFGVNYKRFIENDSFIAAWKRFEDMMYQSMKNESTPLEEQNEAPEDVGEPESLDGLDDIGFEPEVKEE